jgi:hypothetical protein
MTDEIQTYCRQRGFSLRIQDRWLALADADRSALLSLMQEIKAGENHFKDVLDWLEEIALRDGVAIAALLNNLSPAIDDPRLGRNDKLKRLKDELRRLRFPRLARIEDEIQRRVRELKLAPGISLSVPVGLEGGTVTIKIEADSADEIRTRVRSLAGAAESAPMNEIFRLLHGGE